MIDQLFGSKTRVKLLHLFLSNPNRSFYVREITRKIDEQINSVRRELSNMLSVGIITSDSSNNRLYYEVNQKYPHYEALRSIFTKTDLPADKTSKSGEDDQVKKFKDLGAVQLALLTGSFSRDDGAPVDVFVVGDINHKKLENLVAEMEGEEGRELRYTAMQPQDFDYRLSVKDRFVDDILQAKKTVLIDTQEFIKQ